jgi:hypothetical protein
MTFQICYWDEKEGRQKLRNSTPDEDAQRAADIAAAAVQPVPQSIPMLNLQLALIDDGKLGQAEAIIADMPGEDGQRARAYWARALTARLDNDVVQALWPQLYDDDEAFLAAWQRAATMDP